MKILALITARGGSKRLPGKNIRKLGGKPLIVWSIDVAKDIPEICDILVSTDDPYIAQVSKEAGANVPWLRPTELATDIASSVDVAIHALDWYEMHHGTIDGLLLLQPTSPFRTKESVRKGIDAFIKSNKETVLGVSNTDSHPHWTFKIEGEHLVKFTNELVLDLESKESQAVYKINGLLYLISPEALRSSRSFFKGNALPLIIDSAKESLDIDTELDFNMAKIMLTE